MNERIKNHKYINPQSHEICNFTDEMSKDTTSLEEVISNIFKWFDYNVKYSRVEEPYYPLQRNDLEVLSMKAGTCVDYSNLIVSVLINMGIPAKYAYLKHDCYGDEQDHVCAAAKVDGTWVLIDATLPYRKWYGFDCPHKNYELYEPKEFELKMKRLEAVYFEKALSMGNEKLAGLLYAPWIYDDIVLNTEERLETAFYLLTFESETSWSFWISYMIYTREKGFIPLILKVDQDNKRTVQFSIKKPNSLWDDNQWSKGYSLPEIPEKLKTEYLNKCLRNVENNLHDVRRIMSL